MARAVLFDLFGTLLAYQDIEEGTRQAWDGIYQEMVGIGLQQSYEAFAVEWQRQFTTPLATADDCDPSVFVGKLLRYQRLAGLPEDREVALAAANICLSVWGRFVITPPDTLPILQALQGRCALGLVSNFDHPAFVRDLLAQHDLARWFDVIAISAELRLDKPDPRIFWRTLQALGVPPAEALMVGDSLSADITGAEAAGCQAVLIDRLGWHPDYEGVRIETLSELLELV